ncbi:hypothetical protein T492DRAFT_875844 [Pavlovales sp. CCMP2436]|nr:hypothetical protein T492DRAFT_875844 [Pavlovales sp. CCMP2436]
MQDPRLMHLNAIPKSRAALALSFLPVPAVLGFTWWPESTSGLFCCACEWQPDGLPRKAVVHTAIGHLHHGRFIYYLIHRASARLLAPCAREQVYGIQNPNPPSSELARARRLGSFGSFFNQSFQRAPALRPEPCTHRRRLQRFVFGFLIIHHFYQLPTSA